MDKTGFQVGVILRYSLVVTRKAVKAAYIANPKDKILITFVKCVSVNSQVILLLVILL